ncbi:hypothetical protein PVAP13_9KG426933 [Panicum virgatum]|uniref:Uncharacterized protein n=1 Tax=Panicum virgatum TaxID=38727 RepID=A0A8T0NV26_PANVG|nr:hypothetical protein PVAP13_9KG426933 [Panicum virgatum]
MAQHWIPLTIFIWGERMHLGGFPWLGIHNVAATTRGRYLALGTGQLPFGMNTAIISIDSPLRHTRCITIKPNFSDSPVEHNREIMCSNETQNYS